MTDVWLRFAGLLIAQGVLALGLVLGFVSTRREVRRADPVVAVDTLVRMEKKVDDLDSIMMNHLLVHTYRSPPE